MDILNSHNYNPWYPAPPLFLMKIRMDSVGLTAWNYLNMAPSSGSSVFTVRGDGLTTIDGVSGGLHITNGGQTIATGSSLHK